MNLSYKNIALISVFGCLWGVLEMTLGSMLHLFNIPFRGLIICSIVLLFILPSAKLINKRGAIIYMALVACIIKIFSIGGFKISPVIAILFEGLVLEFVFLFLKYNIVGFIIGAVIFCLMPIFHQVFITSFLFGINPINFATELLIQLKKINLGFNISIFFIVIFYILVHLILGIISGILSWKIAKNITLRLE